MKLFTLLIISLSSLFFISCSDQQTTKDDIVELKQQLAQLNKKVEQLTKQIEKVTKISQLDVKIKQATKNKHQRRSFTAHGPDVEALEKITLPKNPTKKAIKNYIIKIALASKNQNSFSPRDSQVAMLVEIGNENLELLLRRRITGNDFHRIYAIERLVEDKDKALILKYLPKQKDLVEIVLKKGWEHDAKQILYDELKNLPSYLPTGWIQAVAKLKDPASYELLKQYLMFGSNKSWTYRAIKSLPNIKLADAVHEAWENTIDHDEYSRNRFASIAMAYGQLDALDIVINALDLPLSDRRSIRNPRRYIFFILMQQALMMR